MHYILAVVFFSMIPGPNAQLAPAPEIAFAQFDDKASCTTAKLWAVQKGFTDWNMQCLPASVGADH